MDKKTAEIYYEEMQAFVHSPEEIVALFKKKNWIFYTDGRPNIIGFRSADMTAFTFNDFFSITRIVSGKYSHDIFNGTTDPGLYYLEHPMNEKGTALMLPGQYTDVYKLCGSGWASENPYKCKGHGGKRRICLRQVGNIKFVRDNNRNKEFEYTGNIEETVISANMHDTYSNKEVDNSVGKDSAACQVILKQQFHERFIPIIKKAVEKFPNSFNYTLIDQLDLMAIDPELTNVNFKGL